MKRLSIYLFAIALLTSCDHSKDEEKIIAAFQPAFSNLKNIGTRFTGSGDTFCSTGIYLNDDSTFTFEGGCEGRSFVSIGKWQLLGDSVKLIPHPKNKVNLSYNIKLSKWNENPFAIFIIVDKTNKPIENFAIQPFNSKRLYNYTEQGLRLNTQVSKDFDGPEIYKTDTAGTIKLYKQKTDSLNFPKLGLLSNKPISISTNYLPDTIQIMINVNRTIFFYDEVRYIKNAEKFADHKIALTQFKRLKNKQH
ncbi:hypothetical protein [Mucilaginibacter celer]|uniref:Lipoprotein n=1 Tax=Mucilaginibacter celer TaxID=2305508 RepID=A0A494W6Q7_9SPHI|nr:hypothetical protein [Mucilaginibacter celer]AYL99205.1 hypothetical protein HYN43_029790 [Mucilaginibacter celer]